MSVLQDDDINWKMKQRLKKAGILSHLKLIHCTSAELKRSTGLSSAEIQFLKHLAAEKVLNKKILPEGGIPTRGITELAGESGAGKTQICLQLSASVQLPLDLGGLSSGAAYVCTEDKFPASRLNQMLASFPPDSKKRSHLQIDYGDNIFVDHVADVESLKQCVCVRLPKLLNESRIGLVVIDSIAAPFRSEYTYRQSALRAKSIRDVALQLHRISHEFNVAIVCVNQVADVIDDTSFKEKQTVPALGLAWANMVTLRMQVFRQPRKLKVISAPHIPPAECLYKVSEDGVVDN